MFLFRWQECYNNWNMLTCYSVTWEQWKGTKASLGFKQNILLFFFDSCWTSSKYFSFLPTYFLSFFGRNVSQKLNLYVQTHTHWFERVSFYKIKLTFLVFSQLLLYEVSARRMWTNWVNNNYCYQINEFALFDYYTYSSVLSSSSHRSLVRLYFFN